MKLWYRFVLFIAPIVLRGKGRFCPICEKASRMFMSFGVKRRRDVLCLHCGSLERHRFLWYFLARRTDFFDGRPKRILHFAPEPCLRDQISAVFGDGYVQADLHGSGKVMRMDITAIGLPARSMDVVLCSHVLEHVVDDRLAMRQLQRVISDGGWAVIMVPVRGETTYEDFSITDKARRLEAFGQHDHLRYYGTDIVDRLRDAGFDVTVVSAADVCAPEELKLAKIPDGEPPLFLCRQRAGTSA